MKFFTHYFPFLFGKKNLLVRKRKELTRMLQNFKYRDVVNEYRKGNISKNAEVSDIIGYCYYQLTKYDEAIFHLRQALTYMPKDYYTNFFLAVSYQMLNMNHEAARQYLDCLKLEVTSADEVLDHLLPLLTQNDNFPDQKKSLKETREIIIEKFGGGNPFLTKIYFATKEDHKLESTSLEVSKTYQFYSAKELANRGQLNYHDLGVPEKLKFIDLKGKEPDIFVDTAHPYIAEIPNAKIVSGSSLVFINDKILSDFLSDKEYGHFCCMKGDPTVLMQRDDALLVKNFTSETEIIEGIMLCGFDSNQYGHWTAEFLPKLRFYEQHPNFSNLPIIIDEAMPSSHYTFLKALTNNQIYILKEGESLKVNNLILAPTDTFFPPVKHNHGIPQEHLSSFTIGALKYIRRKIRSKYGRPKKNPTDRIFLARRSSSWRKLVNEEQIILELEIFGFKTIHIEDYHFDEQVRIFQNAKFIVASNGSSLNNLIFSNSTSQTIMLGQENFFNWGGWFGSFRELGYNIDYLSGKALGNKKNKHQDYEIPPSVLIKRVKELLV